jgi:hypothetical protein
MPHREPETLRQPFAVRPPQDTYPQKRGRPATGKMPTLALRAPDQFRRSVEQWAAKQTDMPRLSEAIRRLVKMGLLSSTNSPDLRYQAKASESATKAKRLAGEMGLKAKK